MTNDQTTQILARLEQGFRADSSHLKKLEQELTTTLREVRQFGERNGSPDDWTFKWHQQWENVEAILRRIRGQVSEMDGSIESCDPGRLKNALAAWEMIQAEDVQLMKALSDLAEQAGGLNAAIRKDWNILARTLESHLEIINAHAQALRIKLELLNEHTKEEVDRLIHTLSKYPDRTGATGVDVEKQEEEYRKAAAQLKLERHKFLGFADVVKALLLWVETPEEREHKNLAQEAGKA